MFVSYVAGDHIADIRHVSYSVKNTGTNRSARYPRCIVLFEWNWRFHETNTYTAHSTDVCRQIVYVVCIIICSEYPICTLKYRIPVCICPMRTWTRVSWLCHGSSLPLDQVYFNWFRLPPLQNDLEPVMWSRVAYNFVRCFFIHHWPLAHRCENRGQSRSHRRLC